MAFVNQDIEQVMKNAKQNVDKLIKNYKTRNMNSF
jgi:hypothetical protein